MATCPVGNNSAGNHPLLGSSSSSSATPSPLPANEAISLQHFVASPNTLSSPTVRPFTRSSEPIAAASPLQYSLGAAAVQAPPHSKVELLPLGSVLPPPTLNLSAKQATLSQLQYDQQEPEVATPPELLEGSVLIIYSPSISSDDRERILQHLVGGLTQYGIPAHCHDTAYIKSPCQWMEQEIQKAHAVLCVCNKDFHREWDEGTARGKIPVVGLLKHLVHATLSRGDSLAKFATVLLDPGDSHWIPSLYLQGDPRLFLVTEVQDIARFVRNIPTYAPPPAPSTVPPIAPLCAPPTTSYCTPPTALCAPPTTLPMCAPPSTPPTSPPSCAPPTVSFYTPPTDSPYISSAAFWDVPAIEPPTAPPTAPPIFV